MFSRLTILLFVFFAVAGLLHVSAPGTSHVARNISDGTAPTPSNVGPTVGRIIAGKGDAQP